MFFIAADVNNAPKVFTGIFRVSCVFWPSIIDAEIFSKSGKTSTLSKSKATSIDPFPVSADTGKISQADFFSRIQFYWPCFFEYFLEQISAISAEFGRQRLSIRTLNFR